MKTSELIKKLTDLQDTVPFDAEVVTGDDWQPNGITRIYHKPPYTFIEFETDEIDEFGEEDGIDIINELEIRAHQVKSIRDFIQSDKDLTPDSIIKELNTQISRLEAMSVALLDK
ncbi:hypothetical protein ACREYP_13800 [Enterobacter sp. TMH.L2]